MCMWTIDCYASNKNTNKYLKSLTMRRDNSNCRSDFLFIIGPKETVLKWLQTVNPRDVDF
jgi:hypothetical protein